MVELKIVCRLFVSGLSFFVGRYIKGYFLVVINVPIVGGFFGGSNAKKDIDAFAFVLFG